MWQLHTFLQHEGQNIISFKFSFEISLKTKETKNKTKLLNFIFILMAKFSHLQNFRAPNATGKPRLGVLLGLSVREGKTDARCVCQVPCC